MYFLSSSNRFFVWACRTSKSYRYLLTMLCIAGASALWFFGMYQALERKINSYKTMLITTQEQLAQQEQTKNEYKQLERLFLEQQATVNRYKKNQDVHAAIQQAMLAIINAATATTISLKACESMGTLERDWYLKNMIVFAGQGSYAHITQFFQALEKAESLFLVKEFSLNRLSSDAYAITAALNCMVIK